MAPERSMTARLDGKVVLVTGGSSGIGRAVAERVAAEGGFNAEMKTEVPAAEPSRDRIATWRELMKAGRHEEALAISQQLWAQEPDRRNYSWHMVAASFAALGQRDAAIAAVERAEAEDRLWCRLLFSSPALAPLRDDPAFRAAAARTDERIRARDPRPKLLVAQPEAPEATPRLILDLHGANGDAGTQLERWRPATTMGWTVAAAQSSQPSSATAFCWDDPAQNRRDLAELLANLPPHNEVVLTGFSQGAAVAIEVALDGEPVRTGSVIALAAAFGPGWRPPASSQPLRITMLTGASDPYLASGQAAAEALLADGHDVTFEEVPTLGHEFPPDFPERIPGLLRIDA